MYVRIALGQINTTIADFAGNSAKIIDYAQRARGGGAELVLFPELSICGYPPRDLVERPWFVERNRETAQEIARQTEGIGVVVGLVTPARSGTGKSVLNSAALLCGGKIALVQSKRLLPTYDVFDEMRNFAPADSQKLFPLNGRQMALTICEDAWNDKNFWVNRRYERDPITEIIGQGTTLLLNISASPYTINKRALRFEMLRSIAVNHKRPVIYVNQVGGDDSLIFDGGSMALTSEGKLAAQAVSFEEDLVIFDSVANTGEIHEQPHEEIAYAFRALVTGTRDYVRKCNFRKTVIGLSGGIDSAVVACIAVEALGAENVLGVAMPGPYSSEGSQTDARQLAENLGIRFLTIPITEVFAAYEQTLAPTFAGLSRDVTEENIQARIRGNYLMALSNKFGHMVLSTGNKSELAVGYCTLYGDMAGGLAVISDVPKLMVYELANWINRDRELIPRSTIDKPPSAELRPGQKDEDSLPPYDVLDRILKAYIEDLRSPQEIADHYGFDLQLVRDIALLVDRNEYKRKQAAPGLKITSRAFGFGRPFPIAQRYIP